MIGRIRALSFATLAEAVRTQVFINLAMFCAAALVMCAVLDQLALGDRGRVLLDLGVTSLSFVDALLVAFMTVRTLGGEEDRRTLMTILVRPVSRWEVLAGKYVGVCVLAAINVAVALLVLGLGGSLVASIDVGELLLSGLGLWVEACLVAAVTLTYCTFAGTTVAGMLGLGTYLAGLFAGELRSFAERENVGGLGSLVRGFYYAVPNLQRLDFHALHPTPGDVVTTLVYAFLYAGAALALACVIFERRDLR